MLRGFTLHIVQGVEVFQEWVSFCSGFFNRMGTLRTGTVRTVPETGDQALERSNAPAILDLPDPGSDYGGESGQVRVSRAMRVLHQHNLNQRGGGRSIRRGVSREGSS